MRRLKVGSQTSCVRHCALTGLVHQKGRSSLECNHQNVDFCWLRRFSVWSSCSSDYVSMENFLCLKKNKQTTESIINNPPFPLWRTFLNVPGTMAPLYIRIECSSQLLIVAHSTIDRPLNDWSVPHVSAVFTGSDWILISTMWRVWTLIRVPACLKSKVMDSKWSGFESVHSIGGRMATETWRRLKTPVAWWDIAVLNSKLSHDFHQLTTERHRKDWIVSLMEAKTAIRCRCPAFPLEFSTEASVSGKLACSI